MDASHENGQYENRCRRCRCSFTGHKRRVTCRACEGLQSMTPISSVVDRALAMMTGRRPGGR